jgi:type IX secretion system PorP/SprF family membrane protein
MSRAILLLFLLSFTGVQLSAQQDAHFTHYMYNQTYFNPAFAGLSNSNSFMAIHRSQWFGYDGSLNSGGAPTTQFISYNGRTSLWNGGFGAYLVNDNLGPTNNLELQLSGSFVIDLNERSSLTFGLKAGFFSTTLNFDDLTVVDPNDNLVGVTGTESQINPDLGFGILYRNGNFFGGLSANHLLEPEFDFGNDQISNQLVRHYYVMAGYDYALNQEVTITPTLLIKNTRLEQFSWDLTVIAKVREKLWFGAAYRDSESASALIGYRLLQDRSLSLGYAFDFVINDAANKAPTSQELMLIYTFGSSGGGKRKLGKNIIRTPRYRY